ncbi:MAG TPA: dolichyl-phosphate beta-glucosyltransferase [Terriglobales bacterium]|jgi:glycosyltransferase involved in cell wall biosynthesis
MPVSLSIVIPAYNEAQRLPATLRAIAVHFSRQQPGTVEVLIVDDGSSDGTASLLTPEFTGASPILWRMLKNPGNRGKGYSVRHGMIEAAGDRMLFTDADLSAPMSELARLETALDAGADIAIGSRSRTELLQARQSWLREQAGRMFNRMVRWGLGLPFADTQCGFKLFNRPAALSIFPQQRIEGWGFDPELLFLARRYGLRVEEVPVVWAHAAGAKIRMVRDSLRMFGDLVTIRRHAWRGRYALPPPRKQQARAS